MFWICVHVWVSSIYIHCYLTTNLGGHLSNPHHWFGKNKISLVGDKKLLNFDELNWLIPKGLGYTYVRFSGFG